MIALPKHHESDLVIASISGGKDSAALAIALQEAGIPFVAVFADTGWEAPETYAHLGTIERVLGIAIHRVGFPGGMRAKVMGRSGFPSRMARWCTAELKVKPLDAFAHEMGEREGRAVLQAVGIRADESESRSAMTEVEHDDSRDLTVWRPLLRWTVEDVIGAHHRAGLPMHPHYLRGHSRVGCWPCIYSSKSEIALWAEHDPEGVKALAELELEAERERARRNAETPGRYSHETASFFQAREVTKLPDGKRVYLPVHVEQVVEWARTDRGGKQMPLIREQPAGGCFRWGMCEPPAADKPADEEPAAANDNADSTEVAS